MKEYYFDNSATSSPKPSKVYAEAERAIRELNGNPGRGSYKKSLEIAREIYEVREKVAKFFNVGNALNVAFTQNATMSLNMAIKGILKSGDHVLTSTGEHNSVIRPLYSLKEKIGIEIDYVSDGNFEKYIKENTKALIVNHISNVTGKIMDIERIGRVCKENNLIFMVDVSQSAGFLKVDMQEMNIDVICFTGHKSLYGIQGVGGICIREGIRIEPFLEGGTGTNSKVPRQPKEMPELLEAGTLNVPGILSLGAGLDFINEVGLEKIREHEIQLTKKFIKGLKKIDGVELYDDIERERGPVVSINIKGLDTGELAMLLDEEFNIMVRSGFHCAPLKHEEIGTVDQGSVRFSFGYFNTEEEIDYALKSLEKISKNF
jgi:cysteine desulfurase family protein